MGWSSWSVAPTGRLGPILSTSGRPGVRRGWGGSSPGYGSADRGDGWPALFVCWNDDAESVFQRPGERDGNPPADHHHQTAGGAWPLGQLRLLVGVRPAGPHRPGSACFMAPATMRAWGRYSGVNANLILRICAGRQPDFWRISSLQLTLGGTPSPVLDLRRASDRRFHRVFGNPCPFSPFPRESAWKGLYAHSGGR